MDAAAGPVPLAELSPQSSRLSSPTLLAGRVNLPDTQKPRPPYGTIAKRELRDSGIESESSDMSWKNRKRSAADAADDDDNTGAMSADSGSQPVENNCFLNPEEKVAADRQDESNGESSASDSGTGSVDRGEETPSSAKRHEQQNSPDPVDAPAKMARGLSTDMYMSEASIEDQMERLRTMYKRNLKQYWKKTEEAGYRRDPPFHRPAERRPSPPGGQLAAIAIAAAALQSTVDTDDSSTRRSKRQATSRSLSDDPDDDTFGRRSYEDRRQRSPTVKAKASPFNTKPTPEEVVIDGNGHKTYQCLMCPRKFTHPPAFSQHKRSHGREQAAAAAAAATASVTATAKTGER